SSVKEKSIPRPARAPRLTNRGRGRPERWTQNTTDRRGCILKAQRSSAEPSEMERLALDPERMRREALAAEDARYRLGPHRDAPLLRHRYSGEAVSVVMALRGSNKKALVARDRDRRQAAASGHRVQVKAERLLGHVAPLLSPFNRHRARPPDCPKT